MADYTFDGKRLKKNSSGAKIGEIDRDAILGYNAARLGEIQGKNIRDNRGKKVAEFDGKTLKDDRGKAMIAIKDVQEIIEGDPGIHLAALWYFFVRK